MAEGFEQAGKIAGLLKLGDIRGAGGEGEQGDEDEEENAESHGISQCPTLTNCPGTCSISAWASPALAIGGICLYISKFRGECQLETLKQLKKH